MLNSLTTVRVWYTGVRFYRAGPASACREGYGSVKATDRCGQSRFWWCGTRHMHWGIKEKRTPRYIPFILHTSPHTVMPFFARDISAHFWDKLQGFNPVFELTNFWLSTAKFSFETCHFKAHPATEKYATSISCFCTASRICNTNHGDLKRQT